MKTPATRAVHPTVLRSRISDTYEAIHGFRPDIQVVPGPSEGQFYGVAQSASQPRHKGVPRTTEHAALWALADLIANVFLQQERKRTRIRRELATAGLGSQMLHGDLTSTQKDIEFVWRATPYAPNLRTLKKERTAAANEAKKALAKEAKLAAKAKRR